MQSLIPDYRAFGFTYDAPPLCPEHEQSPETFEFSFSAAVRTAFRSRKRIPTREWAERYREIPNSSRPGRWKNENIPYAVGVFDAWDKSSVRCLVLCWVPQVGKTAIELTCLASIIDQDPGPAMIVMDTDGNASDLSKDHLLPMLRQSPRLAQYLSSDADKTATYRIDLTHMPIYVAYATSVSALASKAIRIMIWDEIDKHGRAPSKKEADSISLGRKRQRTYRDTSKEIYASSPSVETGPIWRMLNEECQVVFHFWARCPDCGAHQVLVFKQLKWPEDERDPIRIQTEKLASYECEHCGSRWDDFKRDRAVRMGEWRTPVGQELNAYLDAHRPQNVGFHLSAFYSAFVGLSEIAAAFVKADREKKKGNLEPLKDFCNAFLGEPWVDYQVERDEDKILALCDERPRMLVPTDCLGLTCAIDTQDYDWVYAVRAWGQGFCSWLVREGRVETEEGLRDILFNTKYEDAEGRQYVINVAGADVQGHRTAQMYDFCRQHGVLALRGEQTMAQPYAVSKIDTYPGTNRPIPGGLRLHRLNSKFFKDWLARLLAINPADPGAFLLYSEVGMDYARQMCAEFVNDKGVWECPKGKDNHFWDVEYMGLFLAYLLGIGHWQQPKRMDEPKQEERPQSTAQAKPDPRSRILNHIRNKR